MASKTELLHAGGFIISEANGNLSRDNAVLITGQNLKAGAVLGKITVGAAVSAAKAGGNTGNGTLTLDVATPVRPGAKVGVYAVRCIAAAANNGTFRVEDPDGNVLGDVVMAAGAGAFDDDIKFALADGAADFIVGDGFDVTVAAGSGKYTQLAPAAANGSQSAAAILLADVDATAADVACAVVARQAEVNGNELTWPGGITADQTAAARAQLAQLGILVR